MFLSEWSRRVSSTAYLCYTLAGLAAVIWPAPLVQEYTGWSVYVWGGFLVLGGLGGLYSTLTDRWIGEYVGAWALVSSFAVFGLVVMAAAPESLARLAFAFICFGIAANNVYRWLDVEAIRKAARASALHRQEEGESHGHSDAG